jgi:acyl-CoA reductase-like NAD-dependent aldehyde dehydrogenase
MSSPLFPEPPPSIPPTPVAAVDALLARLVAKKDAWVATGIPERLALLEQVRAALATEAAAWAATMSRVKGIQVDDPLHGEDWLAGPVVMMRNVQQLKRALAANGQPRPPGLRQRKDGQWVADVMPWGMWDRVLLAGWQAEVWIEPGQPPSQGHIYREKQTGPGKVGLVLSAGNVTSIGPMDVLTKLFVENEVVVMKMNPVNEAAGPHIERIFAPLTAAGVFGIVYGGGDIGKHLTDHNSVDTIHITGSDKTHDLIIWGSTADEQAKNKAAGTPRLNKPITSELGCVTPVLVLPGPWSDHDLRFQADQVAGMIAQNGSFNCNAAKVLVTWKGWPLRERFLSLVEESLRRAPPRKAYYPGAQQRYKGFLEHYPNHKVVGTTGPDIVPWTILPDVPAKAGEYALSTEAFCGVVAETALSADSEDAYIAEALRFANDDCWGTLSCMVMAHPKTQTQHAARFDELISGLRYGGIAINGWAGSLFGTAQTTWGAFPGHPLDNIVSGRGAVHNTLLFDHPQKSVIRLPWSSGPKPVWSPSHKTLHKVGKALFELESEPSPLKVPGLLLAALQG